MLVLEEVSRQFLHFSADVQCIRGVEGRGGGEDKGRVTVGGVGERELEGGRGVQLKMAQTNPNSKRVVSITT